MKFSILFFSLLGLLFNFQTQAQDSIPTTKPAKRYFKFIPLPVIGASPTTGFMFGIAPGAYWLMGDESNTKISSALGSLVYTENKQLLITAKANTFFKENKWNMLTDIRYFITSQPTYGLGTGPQSAKPVANGFAEYSDNPYAPISSAQMMAFNYLRIHNTLAKSVGKSTYVGLGYHLDYHYAINDKLLNLDTLPNKITSHYAYQTFNGMNAQQYVTSGISVNAIYDSRDNQVNPYKGRYAFASVRMNPTFIGSEQNSMHIWLESREYLHLSKERPRHLIGFWNYAWFAVGKVPYLDLPALGWDMFGRSGRAYTQGRFRGEQVIYNEIEYRFPLQREKETFGAVLFVNGTTATNFNANINVFNYYDIAYGGGLRIMINKKSRVNLSLDYAFGQYGAQGFYLGLNEVF
jgi:hypothetical protein